MGKKVTRVVVFQHDEDLGPEWLNEDNMKALIFSPSHLPPGLIEVKDVTEELRQEFMLDLDEDYEEGYRLL